MSSITLTTTRECTSGNHITISVTGDVTKTTTIYAPDMLGAITDEEADAFLKVLLRIAKKGRTNAQVKTMLTSGMVVTI